MTRAALFPAPGLAQGRIVPVQQEPRDAGDRPGREAGIRMRAGTGSGVFYAADRVIQ